MNSAAQPSNYLKVWSRESNVRFWMETAKGHLAASSNVPTMYGNAVTTEKMKAGSYFFKKERKTKEIMRFMKNNSCHILVGKRKNCSEQISIFVRSP